jgi:ABC-type nitrate/sulfonate/bicarbonate transport system substrate-binding protein
MSTIGENHPNRREFVGGSLSLLSVLALAGCESQPAATAPLRIGWQTAWASQGQVMQALIRTNIPALVGANLTFPGFQYGPDLNEAAVAHSIDVTNAGIVPVINLLSHSPDWIIIGRQVDFYISIVARAETPITSIRDLRGKRFGVPIGGGSHPYAISQLANAGLDDRSVTVVNVAPTEMLLAFRNGDIDAAAVWDPTAQLLVNNGGRIISEQPYVGFVTAHRPTYESNQQAFERALRAYGLAYMYAASHKQQTDAWFAEVSHLPLPLVSSLRVIEPNLRARQLRDVVLVPTPQAIALCQEVADRMRQLGLIQAPLNVASRMDVSAANSAQAWIATRNFSSFEISAPGR